MGNASVAISLESAKTEAAAIPWQIWVSLIAISCAMVGGHWDIAWHRSVGRDAFWTPPHVVLYLCGVLAAFWSITLIAQGTIQRSPGLVRIWGFRAPLGAFLAAWGGATMLASAPFDDWWHGAYGLDVKIVSPPHVMLILGILAVYLGTLLLVLGRMNRATGIAQERLSLAFLYVLGGVIVTLMLLLMEYTHPVQQHGARFYRVVSWAIPIVFAAARVVSKRRWATTIVASIYTVFHLALLWVLPLVPAEPKLGPVYQHVTHLIPPWFPALIVAPAIAIDLLWPKITKLSAVARSAIVGVLFVAVLMAVQWPFASFLISPLARNAFFGMDYYDYNMPPQSFVVRHLFFPTEHSSSEFVVGIVLALVGASLASALGAAWGRWMTRVQR